MDPQQKMPVPRLPRFRPSAPTPMRLPWIVFRDAWLKKWMPDPNPLEAIPFPEMMLREAGVVPPTSTPVAPTR